MSLESWLTNAWLRRHEPSQQEIRDLLRIVERDLGDARSDLSADWRFGIAYNAAQKLCFVLLHASGYRAEKNLHHYRTIQALPLILGAERKGDADYLDACRVKRNQAEYDRVGVVSDSEAEELIAFVKEFRRDVIRWLKVEHPALC
ncbi:MAG: hypothetical protein C0623_01800 [Desulfuromonas sp.]|nr:MAG: hypothetical protein C0623_01800 [Desulfuromonas sp.]